MKKLRTMDISLFSLYIGVYITCFYARYETNLRQYSDKTSFKLSKLFCTAMHAICCGIMSIYYLWFLDTRILTIYQSWSVAYFTYDTVFQVLDKNYILFAHHIASILVFLFFLPKDVYDYDGIMTVLSIGVAEFGNFAIYNVSYKIYVDITVTKFDLLLEAFNFVVLRNILGMFVIILLDSHMIRVMAIIFWMASVMWGFGICKQIYNYDSSSQGSMKNIL